jgi:hypothetical protein
MDVCKNNLLFFLDNLDYFTRIHRRSNSNIIFLSVAVVFAPKHFIIISSQKNITENMAIKKAGKNYR